jgi:serine/threonine-protein kinase
LVQDYVPGPTYRQLLEQRQAEQSQTDGLYFAEWEITEFLHQVLTVLQYLHDQGVVHRDLSPDNLIHRYSDGLPVLIDFGAVKELALNVVTRLGDAPTPPVFVTRLGKRGYAPPEQLALGQAFPHSDLYALGVTALTLLSGKEPQDLVNPFSQEWIWRELVSVSTPLAELLEQLVTPQPSDRFPCAAAALSALNGLRAAKRLAEPTDSITVAPTDPRSDPRSDPWPSGPWSGSPWSGKRSDNGILVLAIAMVLSVTGMGLGWWLVHGSTWQPHPPIHPLNPSNPSAPSAPH